MTPIVPNETVVKEGTFLYDARIECDVRIVRSSVGYGSGDGDDLPELANDLQRETYYICFGPSTERGIFNAGSDCYPSLAEAVAGAESTPGIGSTVRWKAGAAGEA